MTTNERDAVNVAKEAILPKRKYRAWAGVTTRQTTYQYALEAVDMESAISKLGETFFLSDLLDLGFDSEPSVEGDEIIYILDAETDEQATIDARSSREPMSWTAVQIIKDLANSKPGDDLTVFLVRARESLERWENEIA